MDLHFIQPDASGVYIWPVAGLPTISSYLILGLDVGRYFWHLAVRLQDITNIIFWHNQFSFFQSSLSNFSSSLKRCCYWLEMIRTVVYSSKQLHNLVPLQYFDIATTFFIGCAMFSKRFLLISVWTQWGWLIFQIKIYIAWDFWTWFQKISSQNGQNIKWSSIIGRRHFIFLLLCIKFPIEIVLRKIPTLVLVTNSCDIFVYSM